MDWHRVNFRTFVRGPLTRTPEGIVTIIGSVLSFAFAGLGWYAPAMTGLDPMLASDYVVVFGAWPVILFSFYVLVCSPDFQPTAKSIIVVVCAAAFPFWMVYK